MLPINAAPFQSTPHTNYILHWEYTGAKIIWRLHLYTHNFLMKASNQTSEVIVD